MCPFYILKMSSRSEDDHEKGAEMGARVTPSRREAVGLPTKDLANSKPLQQLLLAIDMEHGEMPLSKAVVAYLRFIIPDEASDIEDKDDYEFLKVLFEIASGKQNFNPGPPENVPEDLQKMSFFELAKYIYINSQILHIHFELLQALYHKVNRLCENK